MNQVVIASNRWRAAGPLALLGLVLLGAAPARAQDTAAQAAAVATTNAGSSPLVADIKTKSPLLGVDFSPDGKRVVACGLGRDILVYDIATRQPVLTLKGHADDVVSVKYSPNGRYIASGGVDHALILWDALTGELIRKNTDHTDYVRDVTFSPNSKLLASAGWDGQALVFDTFSGQRLATLKNPKPSEAAGPAAAYDRTKTTQGRTNNVTSVAFNPDGTELLTASGDHTLRIWNTETWQQKALLVGHTDEVWDARYAPNGQFAVSGAWDNTARVWDLRTNRVARVLSAHVSDVWATTFSPDGQLIATGGGDRKVKIWDAVTGLQICDISGDLHTAEVENLAFSADGRLLASVSRDGTLKLWQVPTTSTRIGAYARYNYEKWARKGEFEKTADFDERTAHKVEKVQEFQKECQALMLANYGNTANWKSLTIKDYNADKEQYTVASAAFPARTYHVKVSPKEAELFRTNFATATYGVPTFSLADGDIVLDNVSVSNATRQYTITR